MKAALAWFSRIFTEADGNGGKASYGRIFGAITIVHILAKDWQDRPVNDAVMTLFFYLVGYTLLSKLLSNNPILTEYIKLKLQRKDPAQ